MTTDRLADVLPFPHRHGGSSGAVPGVGAGEATGADAVGSPGAADAPADAASASDRPVGAAPLGTTDVVVGTTEDGSVTFRVRAVRFAGVAPLAALHAARDRVVGGSGPTTDDADWRWVGHVTAAVGTPALSLYALRDPALAGRHVLALDADGHPWRVRPDHRFRRGFRWERQPDRGVLDAFRAVDHLTRGWSGNVV